MSKQVQPTPFSFPGGKRYAAFGPAFRALFGGRIHRVSLDAGFTCPTRDGTVGHRGCLYCDAGGGRSSHVAPKTPIPDQLARGIVKAEARYGAKQFIAYFQAFSNTYNDPAELRRIYEEGLSDPRIAALAIATRPDCLDDDILDVLEEFAQRSFLWVEIGLQSTRDATLETVERGHTVAQFIDAAQRLRKRGLRILGHMIAGLPGDEPDDTIVSADLLNCLDFWGVKIHNLFIDTKSPLAPAYHRGEIRLLEREEYLDILVAFLARLSPDILVHRLLGQAPRARLVGPAWCDEKENFTFALDRLLEERDLYQGAKQQVFKKTD